MTAGVLTLVAFAALHRLSLGLPAWIVLKPVFAVLLLPQTWRFVRCVGSDLSSIGEGDELGRKADRNGRGTCRGRLLGQYEEACTTYIRAACLATLLIVYPCPWQDTFSQLTGIFTAVRKGLTV